MKNGKIEWSALLICEIVFGFIGAVFTVLGILFGIFIEELAASPNSQGNVYIMPWVFGSIGIVFLLVCAILLSVSVKRGNMRKHLIENGSCINACVIDVRQNLFVRINKRHPYYVICEGINPYTGETLTFRSADIMENPSYLLGRYLRVFVDYDNPENYYVEIHRIFD